MRTLTLGRSRARGRTEGLTDEQHSVTWQSASLLLGYPDTDQRALLPLLRRAADELPDHVGAPLARTLSWLEATPLEEAQAEYVETFDSRRRHNLFLTYFAHGDTRKRGVALLRFKQEFLAAGYELDDSELPDHLCVVLEFGAAVARDVGRQLLLDHRAGLELLRLSLTDAGSPWAGAVEAVTSTLPPLGDDEWQAVRRLAAEGPPEEEVGLTPYETPGFDPGAATPAWGPAPFGAPAPSGPVTLPMPSFPGAR